MASVWGSVEEAFDLVVQSLHAHTETFKSVRARADDQQAMINTLADSLVRLAERVEALEKK